MYDKLVEFIRGEGHAITDEIRDEANKLLELIEAENAADISEALQWLEEKRKNYIAKVEEVPIRSLEKWKVDPETGNISHESGRFFSIVGVKVTGARGREVSSWGQPIMKQAECGILGILRQRKNGIMHYLLYAKSEPGAVVNPQLSPTLQATASNLAQVHGGTKPLFAEYFEEGGKGKIIVSVEHVEDPGRFFLKTNKCMIVEVPEGERVDAPEDYIWLTLPQVKKLLKVDKAVNALARAVFGSI